jgi:hypothetical protein
MSNLIRNLKRTISIQPNRKQRKVLHKLRQLVELLEQASSSLQDKSSVRNSS